jgi:hypothetical protein
MCIDSRFNELKGLVDVIDQSDHVGSEYVEGVRDTILYLCGEYGEPPITEEDID